jgi:hypothetical protein
MCLPHSLGVWAPGTAAARVGAERGAPWVPQFGLALLDRPKLKNFEYKFKITQKQSCRASIGEQFL